jgi:hypothetical protein
MCVNCVIAPPTPGFQRSRGEGGYPRFPWEENEHDKNEDKKTMGLENVPRCQHVKVNGTQCGSPALRSRRHCFFHDRIRREQAKIAANASSPRRFELPLLEDANSVQVALMKVIQILASELIYALPGLKPARKKALTRR